ncbi:MAG: phosphopantothenoylcysteine decarboxylase [Microthrixaceae bacterium]
MLVSAEGDPGADRPGQVPGQPLIGQAGSCAREAGRLRGADVVLVTTAEPVDISGVEVVRVETAAQMHRAVMDHSRDCDVVVMAAAVADFTPVVVADQKIKKQQGVPSIELRPTEDILAALGSQRADGQVLVGFAAETDDVLANAEAKMASKGVDLLVVNDVSARGPASSTTRTRW